MTVQEKANELIKKFSDFIEDGLTHDHYSPDHVKSKAVRLSLIAVDEIIEATITVIDRPDFYGKVYSKFWQEVKDNIH